MMTRAPPDHCLRWATRDSASTATLRLCTPNISKPFDPTNRCCFQTPVLPPAHSPLPRSLSYRYPILCQLRCQPLRYCMQPGLASTLSVTTCTRLHTPAYLPKNHTAAAAQQRAAAAAAAATRHGYWSRHCCCLLLSHCCQSLMLCCYTHGSLALLQQASRQQQMPCHHCQQQGCEHPRS